MVKTTDLFELLRELCGCEYISDLKNAPYLSKAKSLMQTISLEPFSLFQLSDMAEYLYGRNPSFADRQEAADFFKSQGKKIDRHKRSWIN
ncbi:hypothetical protein NE604_00690 [Anaerofustis stercorihominis]|uniref:hypothetical protein n=1 Tax=Anaerofustis stercorihominis TaxID=214853 RepID=UPI00210E6B4C|nr:hypothetical protein [Anaerofustis stercorihominis]MCQ4794162.1 hypothetical protein [Anaerofustis stercorihominis]